MRKLKELTGKNIPISEAAEKVLLHYYRETKSTKNAK